MNVNSLIASLIAPAQGTAAASAGAASTSTTPDTNSAQFKTQFGQAVAALTALVTKAQSSGGTSSGSSASATAGGTAATTATDALQAALQKKISDLLAAGTSVQQIVQQLAGALANVFAGQLSGADLAQIQTQLQTTFATALSPPGNGPPASLADLASTLAQRFRQIADLAAGVIGETGQSNRLFAGSFSDAATTAGGQPAPGSTNGNTTADSIASDASALLASLTASQGDGKTVASTAPAIGTNGDTLLGRILARAAQPPVTPVTPSTSAATTSASSTAAPAATTASNVTAPTVTASAVDRAIAAATALLGQTLPAAATPAASPAKGAVDAVAATAAPASTDVLATLASNALAPANASTEAAATPTDVLAALASKALVPASATTDSVATSMLTTVVPAPAPAPSTATATALSTGTATTSLSTSVTAFVKSFTEALAANGNGAPATTDKAVTEDDGTATVLPTTVASTQAPTIGAFAPVAPALHVDALAANPTTPSLPQQTAAPDPNTVIDQVLRGAFLVTTGDSSTVRLRLVPESLGDVTVKLNISGTSVDAQVVAQTPAAHDALVAGQAQLTRSLSDAGLKLTSFNVSLGGGGFTSFQQQQQQSAQQQTPSGQRLYLGDVDTSETDDSSLAAVPSFAPPSSAATGWGAYNYLV